MSEHEPLKQLKSSDLYGIRLLVFMEDESFTNNYRQVILDGRQFKKLSDTIGTIFNEKKVDDTKMGALLKLSDEIYKLPDLREIEGDYIDADKDF